MPNLELAPILKAEKVNKYQASSKRPPHLPPTQTQISDYPPKIEWVLIAGKEIGDVYLDYSVIKY